MAAVLRSSGAWSAGGRNRRPGRGANSARRFGGSLSVILAMQVDEEAVELQLSKLCLIDEGVASQYSRGNLSRNFDHVSA
jgi:hypothetical protein